MLQLEKALERTMFDDEVGAEVRPDHAFLIVLGSISKDARAASVPYSGAPERHLGLQFCGKYRATSVPLSPALQGT